MVLRAFLADAVLTDGACHANTALLAEEGRIKARTPVADIPPQAERISLPGLTLAPGLVDLQVNGGGGVLFNDDPSAGNLRKIAAAHRARGTTSLLPTLMTGAPEKIPRAFEAVRTARQSEQGILGLHLEGPLLNPARTGAQDESSLRRDIENLLPDDDGGVGKILVTLAPELFGEEALARLGERAVLAAGHSSANENDLAKAKKAGLAGVTHLYNAMGPLSARAPGLAGLALADDDLWCSIICDGAHVVPAMMRVAGRAKPRGRLFFISDAMPPAGQTPPRDFALHGEKVTVKNGRNLFEQGGLAGSCLTLFECVRVAVRRMGIPLAEALAMAAPYPARALGFEAEVGALSPGARADMIAFDDELNLQKIFVGGEEMA